MTDRKKALISAVVLIPIGIFLKLYKGPGADWLNNSFDGALYEIFWCLVVGFIWTRVSIARIAVGVFIVTCILEFMQLWHPPFLEMLRSHFLGAALLGTTFDWGDFPYYVLGSAIGWLWLLGIRRSLV